MEICFFINYYFVLYQNSLRGFRIKVSIEIFFFN
jgi:hypothetical protein